MKDIAWVCGGVFALTLLFVGACTANPVADWAAETVEEVKGSHAFGGADWLKHRTKTLNDEHQKELKAAKDAETQRTDAGDCDR